MKPMTTMRLPRLHLLLALTLAVNVTGIGAFLVRTAGPRPIDVSAGPALQYGNSGAFAAPDQLPGEITAAPDSGPGSGRPDSFLPGVARGDGTVFAKYEKAPDGAKVYGLEAAPYTWNVAPGVKKQAFAFNGTVPGPTIRVVEGDKIRVIVTNHLPTGTAVHWHGMVLPQKMASRAYNRPARLDRQDRVRQVISFGGNKCRFRHLSRIPIDLCFRVTGLVGDAVTTAWTDLVWDDSEAIAHLGGEREQRFDGIDERFDLEDLRPDVRVVATQAESVDRKDLFDSLRGITSRDAQTKLRVGDSGLAVIVRVDIDTGVEADQNILRQRSAIRQHREQLNLVEVVDDNRLDA
jgi:hypothetical protein